MRAIAILLLVAAGCRPRPEPADLVLVGGRIYRATDTSPWAEALALRGDRIAAVGPRSEIDRFIERATRVVDLDGRLVLPGFVDGYLNLRRAARFIDSPPLGEVESREELLALVRAQAARRREGEWVLGVGWRYHAIGRPRSRAELDAAAGNRPAFLLSQDGRAAWASSRALEIARVSSEAALLLDSDAIAAVENAIPPGSSESLEEVVRRAHRFGITAVQVPRGEEVEGRFDLRVHFLANDSERERVDGWAKEDPGRLDGVFVGVHPAKVSPDWSPLRRRGEDDFPLKRLVRSGAVVVFGSDWPLSTLDPLAGIAAAVTRETLEGRPENGYAPEERLSVAEAVLAYTRNGAAAMSAEDRNGTLEVGKLADLAVLSEDIFSIPPERIAEVQVAMTVFGGRIVHLAPALRGGTGLKPAGSEARVPP